MDVLISILYGLIQGISEFVPISSSGHLALLPKVFQFKDPGIFFDLTMHLGTAMSVILYFKTEVVHITMSFFTIFTKKTRSSRYYFYTVNMVIATIGTVIMVLVIKKFALEFGRSKDLIAYNLIGFGILMFLADFFAKNIKNNFMHNSKQITRSLAIGLFQALAIFPGVSRSGITLTVSRMIGLEREEATRFSFLLSLPIIFAGFILQLKEVLEHNVKIDWISSILGGCFSFLFGIFAIHFFLKLVKKISLGWFSLYRIILAILVLKYL